MADLADAIIGVESAGDPNARNPRSSAGGLGQFIDSTWLATIRKHRPDLLAGRTPAQVLQLKFDPAISREMTGAYASDNQGYLKSRGIDASPGNSYLAHFAGPQGAAALHANPQAPAAATLGSRVIAANPFLQGKTGADVIDWASAKVGNEGGARGMAGSNLSERLPMPAIGGAPIAGGPVPLTAPNMRYSKLADALLASAAGAKPKGWGDLLNSAGDLALGYTLSDKADKQQGAYKSSLAQALMGANDTDSMARTLMSTGDDDLVKQGVALKVAQNKPQSQVGRFRPSKQGVVDTMTGQIVPGTEQSGAEAAEHGTDAKQYIDKDGNLVYTQLSKAGGRKDIQLPEGARWAPGTELKDVGTAFVPVDKKTGAPAGPAIPKDIVGKEAAEEVGKLGGQAQVALPAAKTMVDNAFKTIGELRAHPGLDVGTGASNVFDPRSWIPGTNSYDFQAKNKQAQGQSFMTARDALKGAGQVTDFDARYAATLELVKADISLGTQLDIRSTPTFFINGVKVEGEWATQYFDQAIAYELQHPPAQ